MGLFWFNFSFSWVLAVKSLISGMIKPSVVMSLISKLLSAVGWGQRIRIIHPHCLHILKHPSAARQHDAGCCNYPWWVILDKLILRRFKTFRNGCRAPWLLINIWIRLLASDRREERWQTRWKIGSTFKILLMSFSWLSASKKWNAKRNLIWQFILIRIIDREQFRFFINVF